MGAVKVEDGIINSLIRHLRLVTLRCRDSISNRLARQTAPQILSAIGGFPWADGFAGLLCQRLAGPSFQRRTRACVSSSSSHGALWQRLQWLRDRKFGSRALISAPSAKKLGDAVSRGKCPPCMRYYPTPLVWPLRVRGAVSVKAVFQGVDMSSEDSVLLAMDPGSANQSYTSIRLVARNKSQHHLASSIQRRCFLSPRDFLYRRGGKGCFVLSISEGSGVIKARPCSSGTECKVDAGSSAPGTLDAWCRLCISVVGHSEHPEMRLKERFGWTLTSFVLSSIVSSMLPTVPNDPAERAPPAGDSAAVLGTGDFLRDIHSLNSIEPTFRSIVRRQGPEFGSEVLLIYRVEPRNILLRDVNSCRV
ncbi:hypothetical protein KC351_g5 [Hortaea werneckii]|nr:hypothetical protein KC351_g5 [Hortaea werneckii]